MVFPSVIGWLQDEAWDPLARPKRTMFCRQRNSASPNHPFLPRKLIVSLKNARRYTLLLPHTRPGHCWGSVRLWAPGSDLFILAVSIFSNVLGLFQLDLLDFHFLLILLGSTFNDFHASEKEDKQQDSRCRADLHKPNNALQGLVRLSVTGRSKQSTELLFFPKP